MLISNKQFAAQPEYFSKKNVSKGEANKNLLIILSACLFGISFLYPTTTWICSVLFLIPLFYCVVRIPQKLTFLNGFIWGLLGFSLNYYGIYWLCLEHGYGWARFFAWPALMGYLALNSGMWFWFSSYLCSWCKKEHVCLIIWMLTTLCFFWWVHEGILWIFGQWQGTPFSFPLVPLASHPFVLWLIPFIGVYPVFLLCIVLAGATTWYLKTFQTRWLLLFLMIGSLFLPGYFLEKTTDPACFSSIGFLKPVPMGPYSSDVALALSEALVSLKEKNPQFKIIVAPESTFPFPLNRLKEYIRLWFERPELYDLHVLIGAHREYDGKLYNSLYWLHLGRIIQVYDKPHIMFFTEASPFIWNTFKWTKEFFLHNKVPFCTGKCTNTVWRLPEHITVAPAICSDLFFTKGNREQRKNLILWVVNDNWFSCNYMKQLMKLVAQFRAISMHQDILYVSHTDMYFLKRSGALT